MTRKVPDVRQVCGVDRLQITCLRRSENPSAATARTPKLGLEITAAVCAPFQTSADYKARIAAAFLSVPDDLWPCPAAAVAADMTGPGT